MEVVVRFPNDMLRANEVDVQVDEIPETLSFLERMETVAWIQDTIEREIGPEGRDLVGPPMAAATFAPSVPEGRDVLAVARRTTTNAQLEASHKNLTKSGYLATDATDGSELWRVSLRAAAFRNLDYGQFVESVRQIVEPVLAAQRLRQVVLRQLVADHPGESFAGDTVCIWDPRGAERRDAERGGQDKMQTVAEVIDSQKLFADSWKMFLQNARLKLQYASYDLAKLDDAQRDKAVRRAQEVRQRRAGRSVHRHTDQGTQRRRHPRRRCPRRQRRTRDVSSSVTTSPAPTRSRRFTPASCRSSTKPSAPCSTT